jgi:16S rRNA (adenine1518-N6/adenine1519-N6)-dimethyltransferase
VSVDVRRAAPVTPAAVRAALEGIGVRPNRSLGQNFLADRNTRDCIVDAAVPSEVEGILEIGPGLGALTEPLAARAKRLVAVEKDYRLASRLRESLLHFPHVQVLCADALDMDLAEALAGTGTVVSNLPYSSGTRILVRLIQYRERPARMAVMVQAEVAERLVASPGGADYGLLAVWGQRDYRVTVARTVSPTCFWPAPEVNSTVVIMDRLESPSGGSDAPVRETFYAVTRRAFQHRRKRLKGALSVGGPGIAGLEEALRDAGVDGDARPETIPVRDWWGLAASLTRSGRTAI